MSYIVDASQIFTLFFITIGPAKLVAPFLSMTHDVPNKEIPLLSLKVIAVATIAIMGGGFLGQYTLAHWMIPAPILLLAAGIVFFLVSLNTVMEQFREKERVHAKMEGVPGILDIIFPAIITPYGVAAVIILLSTSADANRTMEIFGAILMVMGVNLLVMLGARYIVKGPAIAVLSIASSIMGILSVALSLRFILLALEKLNILRDTGAI